MHVYRTTFETNKYLGYHHAKAIALFGTAAPFVVKISSSETVAKFAMAYGLPCQNNEWPLNNTLGYECQSNPANIATNVFGKY